MVIQPLGAAALAVSTYPDVGGYVDARGLIEVFMPLVLAHLIGDFLLQTERMSYQKAHRLVWLSLHATIVGSITWVLCWRLDVWPVVIVVFLTHLVFDAWKARLPGSPLRWYLWDQIGHMAVLLFCSYWMIRYFKISHMSLADWLPLSVQVVVAAYILTFRPITFGMGLFLKPWRDEVAKTNGNGGDASSSLTGLNRSGEWIGNLERCITLSCVLADQCLLVGALLIAKAVLRIGDTSKPEHRKRADYFIIGTLASVGSAILIGLIVRWVIAAWLSNDTLLS